jgi:hypothetical protein
VNFHKYLIDRDGRPHPELPIRRRSQRSETTREIERLLAELDGDQGPIKQKPVLNRAFYEVSSGFIPVTRRYAKSAPLNASRFDGVLRPGA